ncbi:MAG: hypothetical protein LC667_19210, partial [Thioalkalivibrio sp.]|nr:hypothetical protein [Thioalkalivibrio sp.]
MNRSAPTARRVRLALFAALAAAVLSPSFAEAQMGRGEGMRGQMPALEAARRQYESVRNLVLQTSRGVPENVISYR